MLLSRITFLLLVSCYCDPLDESSDSSSDCFSFCPSLLHGPQLFARKSPISLSKHGKSLLTGLSLIPCFISQINGERLNLRMEMLSQVELLIFT